MRQPNNKENKYALHHTKDGTSIYYKDWGTGQPITFSHGWPLTADAWDAQMLFFGQQGYRVIAHDRRGNGRSSQPWDGNDMDHYADDLAELYNTSTSRTPSQSATPPAAAKSPATSADTARDASPRQSSSAPSRRSC